LNYAKNLQATLILFAPFFSNDYSDSAALSLVLHPHAALDPHPFQRRIFIFPGAILSVPCKPPHSECETLVRPTLYTASVMVVRAAQLDPPPIVIEPDE
jgi:hypothetical protein